MDGYNTMDYQVYEKTDSYIIRYGDGSSDLWLDWLGDDVVEIGVDFQYIPRMGRC